MQPMILLGLQNSGKPAEFELKLRLYIKSKVNPTEFGEHYVYVNLLYLFSRHVGNYGRATRDKCDVNLSYLPANLVFVLSI